MAKAESIRTVLDTEIKVEITAVIEREFKRRGVFAELRIERATRIINGATGVHMVKLERAREILSDARSQNGRELPRGIPKAYRPLANNIERAITVEARCSFWDDPGADKARERMAQSPARFEVGDRVLYFSDNERGEEANIICGYGMYQVNEDDGAYITNSGERVDYKFGYGIQRKGDDCPFFSPAHSLTLGDCKPSHLRLAAWR